MAQGSYAQNTEHHVTLSSTCFDDGYSSTILCRYTHSPPSLCPTNFSFLCTRRMYMYVCVQVTLFCVCITRLFCMWVCVCVHKYFVSVCVLVFVLLFFSCTKFCISVTKKMPLPLIQWILLEKIDQSHQSWWMLFLKLPDLDNRLEQVTKI